MTRRWGYHPEEEARIFDLGEGEDLPPGWYDSPAKFGRVTYPVPGEPESVDAEQPPAVEAAPEEVQAETETDWRKLHWKQRVKMAKDLTGNAEIVTVEEADAALEAHFNG